MRRQAPPLEAVEAFILATRSSSFRDAADRLALSPSAFSRRIQALEAFVGTPLFVREKGSVTLSRIGERYLRTVEPAIDAIRRATVDLQAERGGTALRVVVPQSFAMAWLIGKLPEFQRQFPAVEVELRIGRSVADLRRGHADVAILAGSRSATGLPTSTLAKLEAILVCAPVFANGLPPPAALSDLPNYPRLAVYQPEGIWDHWLDGVGYHGPPLPPPTYHEAHFLMAEAAAAGMGVALAPPILVARLLSEGRLVQPLAEAADVGVDYSLVFADDATRRRTDAAQFGRWLADELAAFTAEFDRRPRP